MKIKKKEQAFMIAITIITIIIVVVLMILLSKSLKEQKKKLKSNEGKEPYDILEIEEETKEQLLDQIKIYDRSFLRYDGEKEPQDMTTQEKLDFVYNLIEEEQNKWDLNWQEGVSFSKINTILATYFGENTIITEAQDYLCSIDQLPLLVYDKRKGSYILDLEEHGHGLEPYSIVENFYEKGQKQEENLYVIKIKKVFSNLMTDESSMPYLFYRNYTDAKSRQNPVFDLYAIYGESMMVDPSEKIEKHYQKNKDVFPVYTYTFEKKAEEETFHLISLTKESLNTL